MPSPADLIVVLATGGTIAGASASASDNVGYVAGQVGVGQLIAAVPALASFRIETEQVAQVDSKDMDDALWAALAARAGHHLARDEVGGVVITHGTDTLEETAWFLHRTVEAAHKPLVLTAAMRPATSLAADGPQNLLDAVTLASDERARGVVVAIAGAVFAARDVQKTHSYRPDAFDGGDDGPIGRLIEGRYRPLRSLPANDAPALLVTPPPWPWVEVLTSHAGVRPAAVAAWVDAGLQGLVVAGTGNGTVHRELMPVLDQASQRGVAVALATRCAAGPVLAPRPAHWRVYPGLNPVKARVELMLELMFRPPSA